MSSILKVDTIQTAAGGTPTAAGLGLNVSGSVLQVVSSTKTDFQTLSTGTVVDINSLSVSLTPASASSKILILASITYSVNIYTNAGFYGAKFYVTDGNNNPLGRADAFGGRERLSVGGHGFYSAADVLQKPFQYLWQPNSTSEQTIKVRGLGSPTYATGINYSFYDNYYTASSTLTAIEIAG